MPGVARNGTGYPRTENLDRARKLELFDELSKELSSSWTRAQVYVPAGEAIALALRVRRRLVSDSTGFRIYHMFSYGMVRPLSENRPIVDGDLPLLEVKGPAAATGTILPTPSGCRGAEDLPDCSWVYVVTNCANTPELQEPIKDPARSPCMRSPRWPITTWT